MLPLIIVQARLGSSRLPKKVLKPIEGEPLLGYALSRLKTLEKHCNLTVATTHLSQDDPIEAYCIQNNVSCFRGDESHVLKRFYHSALKEKASTIIRITGDCPIVDTLLLQKMLLFYEKHAPKYDYVSNVVKRSYPKGLDIEIFSFEALEMAYFNASSSYQKEHVTPFILQHPKLFSMYNFEDKEDYSHINVSVDTLQDFELVQKLIKKFHPKNPLFGLKEIKEFYQKELPDHHDNTSLSLSP